LNGDGNTLWRDVRDELNRLQETIAADVTDPAQLQAVLMMANDLAAIPFRLARGENVDSLLASLKAEGLNRALALRTRAATAVLDAWLAVLRRALFGSLGLPAP
jgi:hypothetical protein